MPANKRKRQHEDEKGGDTAVIYNDAETAEHLANDIRNRNPRDTRNRGPCVHCNASGGAAVQQLGVDLTESCIDTALGLQMLLQPSFSWWVQRCVS